MASPKITVEASMPGCGSPGRGRIATGAAFSASLWAWAIYGPADFTGIGQVWVTRDSGRHWAAVAL